MGVLRRGGFQIADLSSNLTSQHQAKVSISSKNSLAITDFHAKKTQHDQLPFTLSSLNKEFRPFFLGDNSIWSFPSVSTLSDYSSGGPESYFSLAIIVFGAFAFIVPNTIIA